MASISLLKIAEKMKLENLTPEINLKGIKVTLPAGTSYGGLF